jgi:hypothetical protein
VKALTIYQPWASLIMVGAKPFEFRGWSPRERGPSFAKLIGQRVVIHAATRPMIGEEVRGIVDRIHAGGDTTAALCLRTEQALELLMPLYHLKKPHGLPLSAGLGTVILGEPRNGVDIAEQDFGLSAEAQPPGMPGFDSDRRDHANFGWPMLEVEKWDEPVSMRGFQGFWNWPTPENAGL